MGRVTVPIKIENLEDLYEAKRGRNLPVQVRTIEIPDALVDTGASGLSIPQPLIDQLGLKPTRSRRIRTAAGPVVVQGYDAVRLTIQERDCIIDVMLLPDECPVLIGQIPLELLDFVVDPIHHQVIGNPAHDGEWVMEMY